jgi:uncharacterized protein (DUF697 family)
MKIIKQKKWELLYVGLFVTISLIFFMKVLSSGRSLYGSDFVTFFYPLKTFIRNYVLTYGSLPLWNPFLFSGTPLMANIQASMFYPLGFLYYLFPSDLAYVYSTILHVILGCCFMYIFMRGLSVSHAGSFISASIFIFNGYFMGHVYAGHLTFVQAYIWIPLIFLFLYRFIETKNFKHSVTAGLLLGVQILGGFPQIAFYTILGVLFFGLYKSLYFLNHQSPKAAGGLGIGLCLILVLGFTLAAIQILPTLEFTKLSTRSGGVDYAFATYESLHPKELLAFILPDIFGNAIDQTYWRSRESWHFWESCGYVGLLPLFLVFIRVETVSYQRLKRFFLALLLLALFLALGKHNPLYPLVYKLPGFGSFRIPAQIIFLYVFGMAVVSGIGMERMMGDEWHTNRGFIPFYSLLGLIFLFLLIGLFLFQYPLFFYLFRYFADAPVNQADLSGLYGRISSSIYRGTLIFLSISILFFALKRRRINLKVLKLVFSAIVLIDLYLFGSGFILPYEFTITPEKKRVVEELVGGPARGRVVTLDDGFATNDGLQFGFASILGYDPLIIRRYLQFALSDQGRLPVDHVVNLGGIRNPRDKLLQLLHLKRAVYGKKIVNLENKIPYAHIVSQAVVKPTEEILSFMKSNAFDPFKMVVVEPEFKDKLFLTTEEDLSERSCTIIDYKNESIIIRASTNKPGYLVMSEIFYPGWKATVDGKEATILPGNFLFRVIPLNEGDHEVHLFYRSWPFRIGVCISLLSLIGSVCFIIIRSKKT